MTLLEEARIAWRAAVIAADGGASLETPTLVASLRMNYLAPVTYDQIVGFEVRVVRIGIKSYALQYTGFRVGELSWTVRVSVPIDSSIGKSRRTRTEERNFLSRDSEKT